MTSVIQVDNRPNAAYNVELDGISLTIELKAIAVESTLHWIFTLKDISGDIISAGRRIKSGMLIIPIAAKGFIGNFMAMPLTTPEVTLGNEPWGNTHELWYFDGKL